MPSEKRQRQREARLAKQEALRAAQRRRATRNRVIAIAAVIGAVLLFVWSLSRGGDGDDLAAGSSTTTAREATTTTEPAEFEYGSTACPPEEGAAERTVTFDAPFEECLEEGVDYRATITTDVGVIEVDLAEDQSPGTVNNFVALARNRFYEGVVCHRVIIDFVVQCGDPEGTGQGGPGYTITEEPPASGGYEIGQLAMAKTALPESTGSQFFIITGPNGAQLPPEYSLLGTITAGLDVAQAIEADGAEADPDPPKVVHRLESVTITTDGS